MSAEDIEKLLAQCKSNDIDAKVDALNKLHSQFQEATELSDVDGVIAALKSCLRTSNQLLTTATLTVIPSFIRILSSLASQATSGTGSNPPTPGKSGTSPAVQHLRQAILAFLPSGGVVERLGEQREKARDSARVALVEISGAAFQSSPPTVGSRIKDVAKGHETPLALVEKHVKELGLASKVARVREQTILALVEVRREYRTFPIRPYLPQLVECLEDNDANVRDCARSSVVTLFTGPQVSDAARTDLKNEMAKKGVRKGIVNDVLSKLLSASTMSSISTPDVSEPGEEGSASSARMAARKPNPLARSATAPTFIRTATAASASTAMSEEVAVSPSTTEIPDVYIASARDLEHEFAAMVPFFEGKETEHNWLDREKSVIRLRGMVRGDVHERYPDAWFTGLKGGILENTLKALQSLRTTVASQACLLYAELATAMATNFDPLIEIVLTHLLKMGGFTKKIAAQQSQASVTAILTYTSATPRLVLPLLWSYAQEKTVQVRAFCTAHFKTILEVHATRPAEKAAIESSGGLDIIERAVKKSLSDPNPGVREQARIVFWLFNDIWPANAGAVMNTLDGVAKKQLDKANPNPGGLSSAAPVATPAPKKSSVAAAIAASRAKAKVLATAPPTLRHAATSGAASKAALPRREGSPSATAMGKRAASPGAHHRAASPVSPRGSGLASPPTSRSASPPVTRPNNLRSPTSLNGSKGKSPALPIHSPPPRLPRTQSVSPPSSPTPPNRRTSSPLVPLGRSTAKPGRSALGQSHAASMFNTASFRDSIIIPPGLDEECITAMQIPLPLDSDEEDEGGMDRSMNLMSFSSAWENMGGTGGGVTSSALSTPGITAAVPDSVIHDNYRAQAQQAESAAAQLLELVHDDDIPALNAAPLVPLSPNQPLVTLSPNPPPAVLPPAPSTFLTPGSEPAPKLPTFRPPPVTPKSRVSSLAQALKDFRNSPPAAPLGQSPLMNRVLFERNDMTGVWWRMRRKAIAKGPAEGEEPSGDTTQLEEGVSKLEDGSADVGTLKTLLFICSKNPSSSAPPSPLLGAVNGHRAPSNGMLTPTTPSPLGAGKRAPGGGDIWQDGKALDNLLLALTRFLTRDKSADLLDYGLMVLYEMVFNQSSLLTGHESLVFSFLLEVRYAKKLNVFEATNAIRDVLIEKCDPILGLSTVHRNLEDFLKKPAVEESLAEARTSSYCFSLVALAKFILLLPPEVLEDELPRIKGTLITALSDSTSASIREAAYVTITSAQMKLRDERQLFTILSGLSETQKHLLTYEFEKLKARGPQKSEAEAAGLQKLGGRIRHLDALPAPHA